MEEEERIFEAKAIGTYNILREDIAIRLVETINWEKLIFRKLKFNEADLTQLVSSFYENFFGLYSATCEFLKGTKTYNGKKVSKKDYFLFRLNDIFELSEEEKERLKKIEEEDGKERATYLFMKLVASRLIQLFEEYKTELKVCGLYDLRKFDIKPAFAYRKSI